MKILMVSTLLLFFAVGCGGGSGGNPGSSAGESGASAGTTETTGSNTTTGETRLAPETTGGTVEGTVGETTRAGDVRVEQLSSGAMGPERRQILIASSARDLAAASGLDVSDVGEGTYIAVARGEKPTGGYTVDFGSANVDGVRVTVSVDLKDPPPDAMVAQALTYPYAAAVLRGVDPGEKEFVFVTRNGREIGWPVRSV